ncbi:hypothetical protein N7539_004131 [Penicillium diatomitis]|uniref:DUF7603 domain-containing protein n=1 Tax=Penicillium diatomitis TaxID=2819901 RepID=A0A9W9XDJ2_9EURO|nr:uncharacterized protein N7539_004131 [Penicillium diatomitis]KAJ5489241.1 hypothetical protein N7539_004131 [Penicillium diatomitis]
MSARLKREKEEIECACEHRRSAGQVFNLFDDTIESFWYPPGGHTPTSRYSVISRASTSSSSGLDYYSHTSPQHLSSQVTGHRRLSSGAGHTHDQLTAQVQSRASLHRNPVPPPSHPQQASVVTEKAHLSSPLSIKERTTSSASAAGSVSPSSVQGVGSPRSLTSHSNRSVVEDDDDEDDDDSGGYFDDDYEHQFTNGSGLGTPLHNRLLSEPFIPILNSPPPPQRRVTSMALHGPLSQKHPMKIDLDQRSMSMPLSQTDPRQPKTPGNKISSFFGWKAAAPSSPGAESSSTEISDGGRSPMPSPMPPLANVPVRPPSYDVKAPGFGPPVRTPSVGTLSAHEAVFASKLADLENELREVSSELAGSIRREMELEDLIERLQTEGPEVNRRTSDYFSDSGTSSVRYGPDRQEDMEKARRAAEQERAQLKADFSLRLQEERIQRTASESHVQILENQVQQLRRERTDLSDLSSKSKELESALDNARRKLLEERQSKDNFEDLLTAMRVELEQLRNERDILRDGQGPASAKMQQLTEQIDALMAENASLAMQLNNDREATQDSASAAELERLSDEIATLRAENSSLAQRLRAEQEAHHDALSDAAQIDRLMAEVEKLKSENDALVQQLQHDREVGVADASAALETERLVAHIETLTRENATLLEQLRQEREVRDESMTTVDETRRLMAGMEALQSENALLAQQLQNERGTAREESAPSTAGMQRYIEEIEALKNENASLAQLQGGRFASIAEEDSFQMKRHSTFGLSRSNSLARKPATGLARSGSLSRSNSVSAPKERETRESLVDKVKDIEAQRDALHRTLKSLLSRQTFQEREFMKQTRLLEAELERARETAPSRKVGYEREVRTLRDEVSTLRARAEDALDGKWQCEKNLAGLKMDLDRAKQETGSLRALLQEHDTPASEHAEIQQGSFDEVMATSSSLELAWRQLQVGRQQVGTGSEAASSELTDAREHELAKHVENQLQTNHSLRSRLAAAIDKGERDQRVSVERINILQNRMRVLEENLLNAQNHSEEELGKHEEEVRLLKENHNAHLHRMKTGSRTPVALSPRPPNAPFSIRIPRLDKTTSGEGVPLASVVQAEELEKHVKALERAVYEVDMEMEEVVGRMNRAQVDVAQLQSDR